MRNGEAVLQSGPVYSLLLGLGRKERGIFSFFGEEHLGSKITLMLGRKWKVCDGSNSGDATTHNKTFP
jgi:hypothetical protein